MVQMRRHVVAVRGSHVKRCPRHVCEVQHGPGGHPLEQVQVAVEHAPPRHHHHVGELRRQGHQRGGMVVDGHGKGVDFRPRVRVGIVDFAGRELEARGSVEAPSREKKPPAEGRQRVGSTADIHGGHFREFLGHHVEHLAGRRLPLAVKASGDQHLVVAEQGRAVVGARRQHVGPGLPAFFARHEHLCGRQGVVAVKAPKHPHRRAVKGTGP